MKNHLQMNWWKYLLIILLPVIMWCSIFNAMTASHTTERVNVLYLGEGLDSATLQQQLAEALPQLTRQAISAVAVDTMVLRDNYSGTLLTARCFDYDILILQQDYMAENIGQGVFTRLTQQMLSQFPNARLYTEQTEDAGALAFGFVLYDGQGESPFARCYTGSQNCYLFISPYSENFDGLNESGAAGNDAALKAAQYLMGETP